ncbi:hypothetical protein DFJ73DRAFT_837056 [Zopfochytrium polystomum]|nr:hypothetical protein DFJ73DRAFT_837056 [Zopfochytrium polystomum]
MLSPRTLSFSMFDNCWSAAIARSTEGCLAAVCARRTSQSRRIFDHKISLPSDFASAASVVGVVVVPGFVGRRRFSAAKAFRKARAQWLLRDRQEPVTAGDKEVAEVTTTSGDCASQSLRAWGAAGTLRSRRAWRSGRVVVVAVALAWSAFSKSVRCGSVEQELHIFHSVWRQRRTGRTPQACTART